MTVISYRHVGEQLRDQAQARLNGQSRTIGRAILDRLDHVDRELKLITRRGGVRGRLSYGSGEIGASEGPILDVTLRSAAEMNDDRFPRVSSLSASARQQLTAGRAVLVPVRRNDSTSLLLGRAADPDRSTSAMIWAEVDPIYVWGDNDRFDNGACIVTTNQTVPHCLNHPPDDLDVEALLDASSHERVPTWRGNPDGYLTSSWSASSDERAVASNLTVIVGQPMGEVFAPLERFSQTLPLVVAVALGIVALTSSIHIRKCVVPLVKLTRAADRVARGHFDGRVVPDSDDEFDDFARSFNAMTEGLHHQFAALKASREIACEILSTLDPERIAETVLRRVPEIADCDAVCVAVAAEFGNDAIWVCQSSSRFEDESSMRYVRPTAHERSVLREQEERLIVADPATLPAYVDPGWRTRLGIRDVSVFPIVVAGDVSGVVALGRISTDSLPNEAIQDIRQVTDQIAVALSNSRRVTELNELHWGTLTALSRTIDAKSPWTAGHSERVMQMALVLGRKLGLKPEELEILRGGALLHDIGKIAVSARILDKDRELTPEEVEIMQQHPRLGASILSPIVQFGSIIPIVAHHHERYDGTGYPDQLAGEEIPFLARILAVPDMFDALTSSRPHRPGWTRREAMDEISRLAGTQLDPQVVQAFCRVMANRASGGAGDFVSDLAPAGSA